MTSEHGGEMDHVVKIWDKPHTVTVQQNSKSVWLAAGMYFSRRIEAKGRSSADALAQWRKAATYMGDR
jgi:hypothetical protein